RPTHAAGYLPTRRSSDLATREVEMDVLPPIEIEVPPEEHLPEPPEDPDPTDGLRIVRVVVDDRASRELENPSLRVAFDENGDFRSEEHTSELQSRGHIVC